MAGQVSTILLPANIFEMVPADKLSSFELSILRTTQLGWRTTSFVPRWEEFTKTEEGFLRNALTTSYYYKVRRARLRAVQEYLLWIAANCATLIALLRLRVTDPELASAPETEGLVQTP